MDQFELDVAQAGIGQHEAAHLVGPHRENAAGPGRPLAQANAMDGKIRQLEPHGRQCATAAPRSLGFLLDRLTVRPQLDAIFDYRREQIEALLARTEDAAPSAGLRWCTSSVEPTLPLAGLTSAVYHAGVPALLIALAVAAAAFVKGSIGFGFPTLGTPLLTLIVDVKTAFLVLIIPNIVMDGLQFVRRGAPRATVRRMATLVACGAVGTVMGTRLLVTLSSRTVMLILGGFILAFVALNVTRLSPRLPQRWEPWASPIAGFVAGVVGGITNVPGTPLVMYFYALRLSKPDFVSAVAFTFVLYKVVQLAAVAWYGLFSWPLLGWSLLLTLAALGGFALGLRVQDRLEQQTFNRVVLVFLAVLGGWLVLRSV